MIAFNVIVSIILVALMGKFILSPMNGQPRTEYQWMCFVVLLFLIPYAVFRATGSI